MAFPNYMLPTEQKIIEKLIKKALGLGYVISVSDGEDWAIIRSSDYEAITAEVAATDSTELFFRSDYNGPQIGSVLLIHGNDEDVISDHSDNEAMISLVELEAA